MRIFASVNNAESSMTLPAIVISELENRSGLNLTEPSDAHINILIEEIKQKTGDLLSINTIKRLLGRVDDGNRQPRISTLNALAHYLDYDSWSSLLIRMSNGSSSFSAIDGELLTSDLEVGQLIEVTYMPDRVLQFLYLGNSQFEVTMSINSKLQPGDTGLITAFIVHFPLIMRQVERQGSLIGPIYTAGRVSGLSSVSLLSQPS